MVSNTIQTEDPSNFASHPKNDEIYADQAEEWFVNNVEENGVLEPVVVTQNSHYEDGKVIISGHRRVDAGIKAGLDEVPVRFEQYETPADELAALVDYNQQREKTFSQKMREALSLESVERSRAKGRQGSRSDLDQNFGQGEWGSTSEKVAEKVGFGNRETYRQARKVWMFKQDGFDWAEELVEHLDEGQESIYSAYTEAKKMEDRLQNQERVQWTELEAIGGSEPWSSSVISRFEKAKSDIGERDWYSATHFLYERFMDETPVAMDEFALHQMFMYLLEKNGYATLNGDLDSTQSSDPLSLVQRRPDGDRLEELYWDEEMSTGVLALRYSVHLRVIKLWMYEDDIPVRRDTLSDHQQSKIDSLRDVDANQGSAEGDIE